jgi:hypothetical protein
MIGQPLPIPSPFAAWIELQQLPILASARPCWRESAHHRFALEDDASTTELTSTAGWIIISPEGGP